MGKKKSRFVRYFGYLLLAVAVLLLFGFDVGPLVLSGVFVVCFVWLLFAAPTSCGAAIRTGENCRNNSRDGWSRSTVPHCALRDARRDPRRPGVRVSAKAWSRVLPGGTADSPGPSAGERIFVRHRGSNSPDVPLNSSVDGEQIVRSSGERERG